MKIPKEYSLLIIVGLFVLAYILDLVVEPLTITLKSPYAFFTSDLISIYPFSTASIFIKTLALFLAPQWLLSFSSSKGFAKPAILLVWAGLTQLYAVQEVMTNTKMIPLEWSLSLAGSGFALFFPTAFLFLKAVLYTMHRNLSNVKMEEALKQAQQKAKEKETQED